MNHVFLRALFSSIADKAETFSPPKLSKKPIILSRWKDFYMNKCIICHGVLTMSIICLINRPKGYNIYL